MNKFTCIYYLTESDRPPVEEFIRALNLRTRQKFFSVVSLLEEFGKQLLEPHAKYIGDDIYELRFRGQEGHIRILYFFYHQNTIVLANGFIKKTNKVPSKEKQLAIQRRQAYLIRTKER